MRIFIISRLFTFLQQERQLIQYTVTPCAKRNKHLIYEKLSNAGEQASTTYWRIKQLIQI